MDPLVDIAFAATAFEWRGPAPFVFAAIPANFTGEIRWAAREASYGWGVVPVTATISGLVIETALFPRNGAYLLPLKNALRRAADIALGDTVAVTLRIYPATAVVK